MRRGSGDLVIREPRAGDGLGLAAIWSEAARYYTGLYRDDFQIPPSEGLAEWFEGGFCREPRGPDRRAIVATLSGQVVGLAVGTLLPPLTSARQQWNPSLGRVRLHVDVLAVHPGHWRRGIGQRLAADLEGWARDRKAAEAVTETYSESPVSVSFWQEKMGYTPRSLILRKRL